MNHQELFVKIALDNWQFQVNALNTLLGKLSEEELMNEVSPTRNRGIYLLGHLTAVHDLMLSLLRFEDAMYPALQPVFIFSPDKDVADLPSGEQLKEQLKTVNEKLQQHFNSLSADQWMERHASVSEEDFVKEPHRNRLNVLLSRTNHLSYHRGQMALLAKKG